MRVFLVNPKLTTVYNPFPFPPLGLMILAANIRDQHQVEIFDRNLLKNDDSIFLARITKFKPDVVGITSLTGKGILDGLYISKMAKENGAKVVWGGTHVSMFPLQALENKFIDYVVVGEGERTFPKLLKALEKRKSVAKIKGLVYKTRKKIKINPERVFIKNLDDCPMPAWDLIDVEKYLFTFKKAKRKIEIVTSRGCPYQCTFCYNLKFNKRQWRSRSAKKIIEEINFLKKHYQIDSVRFADDLFSVDKKRLKKFCKMNRKTGITWDANCRINDINKRFIEMVLKGGCTRLTFGVESGSTRMLKFLNKNITVRQTIKAFELLSKTPIMTTAAFMIGLPTETSNEAKKTIKLAKRIKASHVHLYPYVPYPGTKLSEYCLKRGLIKYPQKIEDWSHYRYNYIPGKTMSLNAKKINRLALYFQFRNFFNSLKRGEWGIIKNFFNIKGINLLKEIVRAWYE